MRRLTCLIAIATACGTEAPPMITPPMPSATPSPSATPMPMAGFTPDAHADGMPAIWIEAAIIDGRVHAELRGAHLGPVFGLAIDLAFDPTHLALAEAAYVETRVDGRVRFGGARRGPAAGALIIDEPTTLARYALTASRDAETRLEVSQVVLRRPDGSFVTATRAGGALRSVQ